MGEIVFRKINDQAPVAEYLIEVIAGKLSAGQPVFWQVSGGSAISIAVAVSQRLVDIDTHLLTVSLVDERYGPVGHPASNWLQLEAAGFVLQGAVLRPVLTGKDFDKTVHDFDNLLRQQLRPGQYRLGLFGMGADGHTAGILPDSAAVAAPGLVFGYDGGGFQRITATAEAIAELDEAVLYSVGAEKAEQIDHLANDLGVSEQPAQLLKRVAKLTIFNDIRGLI